MITQTKEQALQKCEELIAVLKKEKWLEAECKRLISSGEVPLDEYPDTFVLPRIILKAALSNCGWNFIPMNKEQTQIYKTLAGDC